MNDNDCELKLVVHCNVKENAELIAKILDKDVDNEVYAKTAEWKEWYPGDCCKIMTGEERLWVCSNCDAKYESKSCFCPWCGAKMNI